MVLEMKVPDGPSLSQLMHTTGVGLLTYLLSFVFVGIYWNNHHHMFHLVERVSGGVLWGTRRCCSSCRCSRPRQPGWTRRGSRRPRSSRTA
ncbi:TMEM175 family protein [Kribbella sp. NPDC000426]|uniref:TMEM175 family protein n=1 Tax=Kribbella sp. NPDC000426 TaxID=3154255 RepID=UPI0033340465